MKPLTFLFFSLAFLAAPALWGSTAAVEKADHQFVEAVQKANSSVLRSLLSANFAFTSASGNTLSAQEFVSHLREATVSPDAQAHDYGTVIYLTGTSGEPGSKMRFVRVWVQEKDSWKLLLVEETKLVGKVATPQATVPAGTSCENPCKKIPYDPPSPEAKAVVESWQALEDSVNHRDADGWASHVADEFVFNVKEDGNPLTKTDRVNIIRKQAEGQTVTDIGTVVPGTMKVWVYGTTAVMADEQQPTKGGNPYRALRVWVNRDKRWQLVYSQQTVIEK